MRRSHHALQSLNILEDKDSGEPRLSHKIDLSTGIYFVKMSINGKNQFLQKLLLIK